MESRAPVRRQPAGLPARSVIRLAVESITFVAALALVLFGLTVVQRTFLDVEGGAAAIDGDTLRQGKTEIRLRGIDAPEYLQTCRDDANQEWPCGREAAGFLRHLVQGKTVSCIGGETDRYGRLLATCEAGGRSLNDAMVREGWAVAYRRHSLDYVGLEEEARQARRGIWRGRFEEPEKWRREEASREARTGGPD